jgi:hypothetical protein
MRTLPCTSFRWNIVSYHPNVAIRLNNLGSAYFVLGEKQKAKKYFQLAHAIFKQFLGPEHSKTENAAKWLAACDE